MPRIEPLKSWAEANLGAQLELEDGNKTARRKEVDNAGAMGGGLVAYGENQLGQFGEGRYVSRPILVNNVAELFNWSGDLY